MIFVYMSMIETETERQLFAQFYEKMSLKCLHIAMAITKDKVLAEDVVHEAFIKFITKKEMYFSLPCNEQESLIVIIVKNKAIDILRKERKFIMDTIDERGEEMFADDFDVIMNYESTESYKRLVNLVETLPEIYKNVFYMKYVQDLNNGEIAKLLSITSDAVAVRLNRAKKKLAQMILKGDENYGY